jgi:hypothetical protein
LCLLIFIQMGLLGVMHCVSGRTHRFALSQVLCAVRTEPVSGINVVMLWAEAVEKGYNAPLWMTFKGYDNDSFIFRP